MDTQEAASVCSVPRNKQRSWHADGSNISFAFPHHEVVGNSGSEHRFTASANGFYEE